MIFEQDVCDVIDSFEPKLGPADYIFIEGGSGKPLPLGGGAVTRGS